jgi:hypothetical protein
MRLPSGRIVDVTRQDLDRFWSKTRRAEGGCLMWTACASPRPAFSVRHELLLATRFIWEVTNGPIPDGLEVCHQCDEGLCVELAHLFLGTHRENMLDMVSKGRGPRQKLSQTDADTIRHLYASGGITMAAIGAQYGVNRSTIGYVVRRDTFCSGLEM